MVILLELAVSPSDPPAYVLVNPDDVVACEPEQIQGYEAPVIKVRMRDNKEYLVAESIPDLYGKINGADEPQVSA